MVHGKVRFLAREQVSTIKNKAMETVLRILPKVRTVTLKGNVYYTPEFTLCLDDVAYVEYQEGISIPQELFDMVKDEYAFAYESDGVNVLLFFEYEEGQMRTVTLDDKLYLIFEKEEYNILKQ
jgi:hypothetical protein